MSHRPLLLHCIRGTKKAAEVGRQRLTLQQSRRSPQGLVPTASEQVGPALAKDQQQSGQKTEPGGVTSRGRNDPFLHCRLLSVSCLLSPLTALVLAAGWTRAHRPAMRAGAGGAGKGGGGGDRCMGDGRGEQRDSETGR